MSQPSNPYIVSNSDADILHDVGQMLRHKLLNQNDTTKLICLSEQDNSLNWSNEARECVWHLKTALEIYQQLGFKHKITEIEQKICKRYFELSKELLAFKRSKRWQILLLAFLFLILFVTELLILVVIF